MAFSYSFHSRPIRAILLLLAVVSIFGAPFMVLMPAFAKTILQGGRLELRLLLAFPAPGRCGGPVSGVAQHGAGLGRRDRGLQLAICTFGHRLCVFPGVVAFAAADVHRQLRHDGANGRQQHDPANDRRRRNAGPRDELLRLGRVGHDSGGELVVRRVGGADRRPYTVALGGAVSLVGAIYFTVKLPELRAAARPMYEKAGLLPPLAAGIQAATNQTGEAA